MANVPPGVLNHSGNVKRVAGLREYTSPGKIQTYKVKLDKDGNIIRDQAGNPVLGKKV